MSFITLSTDFGLKDGNAGVLHGVIWGIAPDAQITDISHQISPQNILEGALILARQGPYFPAGTIHVVVVDPGVGTDRRPIAARLGKFYFVGPDNGLCTLLLERAERNREPVEFVHLNKPQYWLPEVSHVFHGRDIFSPVAAHLAKDASLKDVGTLISDPVRLNIPRPQKTSSGWRGEVLYIDSFGNLATNFQQEDLANVPNLGLRVRGIELRGLVHTFGDRNPGELAVLYGSTGSLIVSEVNGSAARRLDAKTGDPVEVFEIKP